MDAGVIYKNGALYPCNAYAERELAEMFKGKEGKMVGVQFIEDRNYENHKRLFAFFADVAELQEHYNERTIKPALLIKSGHCETIISHRGKVTYIPKSISYKDLPQEQEFRKLFKDIRDAAFQMLNEMGRRLTDEQFNRLVSYDG